MERALRAYKIFLNDLLTIQDIIQKCSLDELQHDEIEVLQKGFQIISSKMESDYLTLASIIDRELQERR